jgi:hypothetical protein
MGFIRVDATSYERTDISEVRQIQVVGSLGPFGCRQHEHAFFVYSTLPSYSFSTIYGWHLLYRLYAYSGIYSENKPIAPQTMLWDTYKMVTITKCHSPGNADNTFEIMRGLTASGKCRE